MTTELRIPPERDLPPGRLAQRKEHLMGELAGATYPKDKRVLDRGRRRAVAAVIAAAAVVAGVVAAVALGLAGETTTQQPMRLVAFTTQGDDIVARITHPDAAASDLTAVFQNHGLNIRVKALPVSPSLVGTIVYTDVDTIRSLHEGACLTGGGGGCVVGLVIPADFAGEGHVAVGRAASSDEPYASSAEPFGPGEALHCTFLGQPVANALPVLEDKGLTAEWMVDGSRTNDPNPPSGYVVGGIGISSTIVLLEVSAQQPDMPGFRDYVERANKHC